MIARLVTRIVRSALHLDEVDATVAAYAARFESYFA